MDADPRRKFNERRPQLARVTTIAHEHILYSRRYPERLADIATRLKITSDAALAYAIADQITEEFVLTVNPE